MIVAERRKYSQKQQSGRLHDDSRTYASRTGLDPPDRAVRLHVAHLLEIGIPDAFGFIVGVAYVVANMRGFAAEFT